jgi:hypothetical protein
MKIIPKEEKVIKTISENWPKLTESEKMYLLGQAEGMAMVIKKERTEKDVLAKV